MFAHIRCLKTILVRVTPALATARAISSTSKSTNHVKYTECIKCRHLETHAPMYIFCIHILRYITGKFIKSEDRWKLTLNLFWLKFCHPETTIISQYFAKKSTVCTSVFVQSVTWSSNANTFCYAKAAACGGPKVSSQRLFITFVIVTARNFNVLPEIHIPLSDNSLLGVSMNDRLDLKTNDR